MLVQWHSCSLCSGWFFVPWSFHQSSVTLLISTKHCCHLAFLGAERKQQDPFNGQASIYWWPSTDPPSSADGADFDGSGSHHWSHLHDLLSGIEFFPPSLLAGVVACRPAAFIIISTFCGICLPARQRCLLGFICQYSSAGDWEQLEEKPKLVRMWVVVVRNRWTSTKNCRNQHGRTFGGLTHPLVSTWQPLNTRFVGLKKPMHNSLNSWRIIQISRTQQTWVRSPSFKQWLSLLDKAICATYAYALS